MMTSEIIKAALLGTDKYMPETAPILSEMVTRIASSTPAKEDQFLKTAISTLLYEEAGRTAFDHETILPACPDEIKQVIPERMANTLQIALGSKDDIIFQYCMYLITKRDQVLAPELCPPVLNKALEQRKNSAALVARCGETGRWLCSLNEEWRPLLQPSSTEDVWQLGTLENRQAYFVQLRKTDPTAALALLEETMISENANNRALFVELLRDDLSATDIPFLENLSKDKSQKVKDLSLDLLRRIEGSAMNARYLDFALCVVHVNEIKRLLAANKTEMVINDQLTPDDELFKTGITKVSSVKGVPDHIHVLGQILSYINPGTLAERMTISSDKLLQLFLQHAEAKHLAPFLAIAAARFHHKNWAITLLRETDIRDINLLNMLTREERQPFYERFIDNDLPALLSSVLDADYQALPEQLAIQILAYLAQKPYTVTPAVYQRLALHLPVAVLGKLNDYATYSQDNYIAKYFKHQASEMMRIVNLKESIL